MKILKLTIFLFLLPVNTWATVIDGGSPPQKDIILAFGEANPGDISDFDFTHDSGVVMGVFCARNPFNQTGRSYFRYKNITGREVAQFFFDQNSECDYLIEFLDKVFELVDQDNVVRFELNTEDFSVKRVVLPNIDPYILELEGLMEGDRYQSEQGDQNQHG